MSKRGLRMMISQQGIMVPQGRSGVLDVLGDGERGLLENVSTTANFLRCGIASMKWLFHVGYGTGREVVDNAFQRIADPGERFDYAWPGMVKPGTVMTFTLFYTGEKLEVELGKLRAGDHFADPEDESEWVVIMNPQPGRNTVPCAQLGVTLDFVTHLSTSYKVLKIVR